MCEPPTCRKDFLQKANSESFREQAKRAKVDFQLQRNLLATFVSFCWTESGGALSMAPSTMASQSSALHDQAINCRSTLSVILHRSSLPAEAGHSCFVICS
jgi:hypothetical protein